MAASGEMVRQLDYQKRLRNTLGVRKVGTSTKIQECSSFVRSANEHHSGLFQNFMRKMEADEKLFRDVHEKKLCVVKKFHNTVHVKSTDFNEISFSLPERDTNSNVTKRSDNACGDHFVCSTSQLTTAIKVQNSKKRNSNQATDSSKYGRSFRKLKDAFTPKSKISPRCPS